MMTIGQPRGPTKTKTANPWIVAAAVIVFIVGAVALYVFFISPQPLDTAPIETQLEETPELLQNLRMPYPGPQERGSAG